MLHRFPVLGIDGFAVRLRLHCWQLNRDNSTCPVVAMAAEPSSISNVLIVASSWLDRAATASTRSCLSEWSPSHGTTDGASEST